MSRPSATQSPRWVIARWRSTSAARIAGSVATCDARWLTSGVRIASVASALSSHTWSPTNSIRRSATVRASSECTSWIAASATHRYIAPVSR